MLNPLGSPLAWSSCLQGGDACIAQQLVHAHLPQLSHLQLIDQQHLLPSDVADILNTHSRISSPLRRLEVRACRHITPACGPMLQQLASQFAAPSKGQRGLASASGTTAVHVTVDSIFRVPCN